MRGKQALDSLDIKERFNMNFNTFYVRRLCLQNYRSIEKCDLNLGRLAIFVGPNGSGKSNVLDSLRFMRQALGENLDNALRERGGISEVRRRSTGHPTNFTIGVSFELSDGRDGEYSFRIGSVKGKDYRVAHEKCVIKSAELGGEDTFFEFRNGEVVKTSETHLPRLSPDRLALVGLSRNEVFRPVFDGLTSVEVFSPVPGETRKVQTPDPGDILKRDASNIASVIERIQRMEPAVKERIEEYLALIVPGVHSVRRRGISNWETVEFQQDVLGSSNPWSFQASSMSDGTLRALGVLVALFSGVAGVLGPVGVEEPESALHPAASGMLLDAVRDSSENRQVLLTTHSPDLLDSPTIDPTEIFAVRSVGGTSQVDRLELAARDALKESLFTAGELLRADQLQPSQDS